MYVGIDLAKRTFTATLLETPLKLRFKGETFENTEQGFNALLDRLRKYINPVECFFITENTGVYGEKLYYFLYSQQLPVYREPVHYIRRAFRLNEKTDPIDSRMIAEYGYRYNDQLHPWRPPDHILEQLQILIVNRDLLMKEKTAHQNILHALAQKNEQTFTHLHHEALEFIEKQKKELETRCKQLMKQNALLQQHITNLQHIPGVGLMYAINFCLLTEGFLHLNYRHLAGYLGIIPRRHESGESVYKKPHSDGKGPDRMRKQLHLSAMAAIRGENTFQRYFQRRKAQGKNGKVVMNNIKNKLLRVSCAVVLSGQPYDPDYKSVRIVK